MLGDVDVNITGEPEGLGKGENPLQRASHSSTFLVILEPILQRNYRINLGSA